MSKTYVKIVLQFSYSRDFRIQLITVCSTEWNDTANIKASTLPTLSAENKVLNQKKWRRTFDSEAKWICLTFELIWRSPSPI